MVLIMEPWGFFPDSWIGKFRHSHRKKLLFRFEFLYWIQYDTGEKYKKITWSPIRVLYVTSSVFFYIGKLLFSEVKRLHFFFFFKTRILALLLILDLYCWIHELYWDQDPSDKKMWSRSEYTVIVPNLYKTKRNR